MVKLQIVAVIEKAGKGKTGKDYKFHEVQGIITLENGEQRVGKTTFFDREDKPLQKLVPGQTYEIEVAIYVDRDGAITTGIDNLKPLQILAAAKSA